MRRIDLKCSNCGATMILNKDKTEANCQYCKYKFLIEKEPSIEELSNKEEQLSYARESGKRKAHEDSIKRQKKKKILTIIIVIAIFLTIGLIGNIVNYYSLEYMENPFSCMSFEFAGIDGEGIIKEKDNNTCEFVKDIKFIYSKQSNLSEGEKIKITAKSDRYRFNINSKEYTVSGLSRYLVNLEDLNDKIVEKIHLYSYNHLENINNYTFKGEIVSRTPYKFYLYTNESNKNILYDVYKVNIKTSSGNIYEKYQVVYYKNFILLNNSELFSYSRLYHCGNIINAGDPNVISAINANYAGNIVGFQTIEEFKTYISKDNDGTFIIKEK